jgi:hypothetical protein
MLGEDEGDLNPYKDDFEKHGLYGNESIPAPPKISEGGPQHYDKKKHSYFHHARNHRWNKPEWNTDMTEEETKQFVKMIVGWVCVAIFVYSCLGIVFQ